MQITAEDSQRVSMMDQPMPEEPRAGDPAPPPHIEQMFRAYHERVFRAAYRITGNLSDAEDVLQTVFLRLLRRDHDTAAMEDPGNYLHRAGVNAALDIVRSRRPALPIEHADRKPQLQDDADMRLWLRDSVARLHPTAAEMFALRYFEGYDNGEVARIMNTTESTVAVTLHRTRARLQRQIRSVLGGAR